MADEQSLTIIQCGPGNKVCDCQCPSGPCEHKWDGKGEQVNTHSWSVTCSRCGMDAMSHDCWTAP